MKIRFHIHVREKFASKSWSTEKQNTIATNLEEYIFISLIKEQTKFCQNNDRKA